MKIRRKKEDTLKTFKQNFVDPIVWKRGVRRVLIFVFSLWVFIVAALWLLQDTIIYPFSKSVEVLDISPNTGWDVMVLRGEIFLPRGEAGALEDTDTVFWVSNNEGSRGNMLFFVGNAGHPNMGQARSGIWTNHKYKMWIMIYPGFGNAPGKPDETDVVERAERAQKVLSASTRADGKSYALAGYSMGGGLAARIHDKADPDVLILEAPLANLWQIARGRYPFVPPLPGVDTWKNFKYVEARSKPTLVMHGDKDGLVPYKQGVLISDLLGAKFITLEGAGHNNVLSFGVRKHSSEFLFDVLHATLPEVE